MNFVDSGMGSVLCLLVWIPGFIILRLGTLMQFRCGSTIIKSIIKLIVLIAVVYILLT